MVAFSSPKAHFALQFFTARLQSIGDIDKKRTCPGSSAITFLLSASIEDNFYVRTVLSLVHKSPIFLSPLRESDSFMRIMHEEGEGEKSNALSLFPSFRQGRFFVAKTLVTDMRAGKDRDRGITGMWRSPCSSNSPDSFGLSFTQPPFVLHGCCTVQHLLYFMLHKAIFKTFWVVF